MDLPLIQVSIFKKLSAVEEKIARSINSYLGEVKVPDDWSEFPSRSAWDDFFIYEYDYWSYEELKNKVVADYEDEMSSNGYLSGSDSIEELKRVSTNNRMLALSLVGLVNQSSLISLCKSEPDVASKIIANATLYNETQKMSDLDLYKNELLEQDVYFDQYAILNDTKEISYLTAEEQQSWRDIRLAFIGDRLEHILLYDLALKARNHDALYATVMRKITEEDLKKALHEPRSKGGKARAASINKNTKDKAKPHWDDWSEGKKETLNGKKFSDYGAQTAFANYCIKHGLANSYDVAKQWDRDWRKNNK